MKVRVNIQVVAYREVAVEVDDKFLPLLDDDNWDAELAEDLWHEIEDMNLNNKSNDRDIVSVVGEDGVLILEN